MQRINTLPQLQPLEVADVIGPNEMGREKLKLDLVNVFNIYLLLPLFFFYYKALVD